MAIVQSIKVRPGEPLAFGLGGEYQLKGPHTATNVLRIGIDDNWGNYNPGQHGRTFRSLLGPRVPAPVVATSASAASSASAVATSASVAATSASVVASSASVVASSASVAASSASVVGSL